MMRVLITGAESYLGEKLAAFLRARGDEVTVVDVRTDEWRAADWQGQEAVIHVAGIVHRPDTDEALYDRVNRALALEAAAKAKAEGVRQFVFFSTMSVYGLHTGRILGSTPCAPNNAYGRSKLAAEEGLRALAGDGFRVAVLRPPMIYGPGCKGNYPRLSALVDKLPVFPRVRNRRSMLYVGTLCAFVAGLLDSGAGGLFFPQDKEYVSTYELVRCIAKYRGARVWQAPGFGWLLQLLGRAVPSLGKLFGSLTYDRAMSGAFLDTLPATVDGLSAFESNIRATEAHDA